jgi:hypothetical protein
VSYLYPLSPMPLMWGLATHPADAARIVAFSLFGEARSGVNSGRGLGAKLLFVAVRSENDLQDR